VRRIIYTTNAIESLNELLPVLTGHGLSQRA
jgi:hypothetical protein